MNHLKILQRTVMAVLVMVVGVTTNRLSAQTCPTSNQITITVIPEATLTIAGATTICSGGNATLTATPGGGTGTCTLQWQRSTDGVTWADITGATNNTLSISALTATTTYRAIYTCSGSGCDPITSNDQTVTVNPDLSVTTNLANITECIGGTTQLSIVTTGGSGSPLVYTWEQSTNQVTWSAATSATNVATYTPQSTTAGTTYYRVRVSDAISGCDELISAVSTVVIRPDLAIATNLNNITECVGGTTQLSVTMSGGSGGALVYTWEQSADNSTWSSATGATNAATYTPSSATAGTMYYRVTISDAVDGCQSITSAVSTVVVTPDITITANLADVTECIGGTTQLSVTTAGGSGGALVYTWEQSTNQTTWSGATGATNAATYTPPSTTAGTTYYRVTISDAVNGCQSITSAVSKVVVTPDLSITANLSNITECIGGTTQLSVTMSGGSGGPIVYTWEQSADNSTWSGATGATNSATYTPSSATAGTMYYRVTISDGVNGCQSITSAVSTVVVTPDLSITANLSNITECIGGTTQLSVTMSGGSGGSVVYTWEQSADQNSWTAATGATNSATYTPPSTTAGTTYYRVTISDAVNGCQSITSAVSTVVVTPDLSITANLSNITECIGGTTPLSVTIAGGSGGAVAYTWEQSTNQSTWTAATGATNAATYTPQSATAGTTYYRVTISDGVNGCQSITSAVSTVVVKPDLAITTNLNNITECMGGNTQLIVVTSGGSGGSLVYTWEQSADQNTWIPAASATNSASYTPSSANAGTIYYRVTISDAVDGCQSITSAVSTVVVTPDLSITANLNNITECIGGNSQLTVTMSGGSGGSLVYTWEQSSNNSTWSPAAGATNSTTYTPPSTTAGTTYYRVTISDAVNGCQSITSAVSTVVVTPDISITTNLANVTECIGGDTQLKVVIAGGSGGPIVYTWEQSADNSTWSAATGATNAATYTPQTVTAGTMFYRVTISDGVNGCQSITSAVSTVVVTPDLSIIANLNNITECIGGTTPLTVTTVGGSGGPVVYTWEQSTNQSTWTAATGATNAATYTPPSTTAGTTYYRVTISDAVNGCQSITSAVSTVTINADIAISTQPADITECVSGDLQLSVTAAGGVGTLVYQWEESTNGTSFTDVTGATSSTYTPPSTAPGVKYYRVRISNGGDGCQSVTSATAKVTVVAKPTITIAASTSTICVGGGVVLTATTANGTGTCTIQWQNSTNGGTTWIDIPGANGTTYTTPALNSNTTYQAKYTCTGNGCCN